MLDMVKEEIKEFSKQSQIKKRQIVEIENKRTQLAEQRNFAKKNAVTESDWQNINELGREISNLGNQSQELQKQVDREILESKQQIISKIDNLIAEEIRKARLINEQIQELEENDKNEQEKKIKYEMQKQEFYERFGRIPEFSEETKEELEKLSQKCEENQKEIKTLETKVNEIENKISKMANIRQDFKNGNLQNIIVKEENIATDTELRVEEIQIEAEPTIEQVVIEELPQFEEITIEELPQIEEIAIEEAPIVENIKIEEAPVIENIEVEEAPKIDELNIEDLYVEEFKELEEEKENDPIEDDIIKQIEMILQEQDEKAKNTNQIVENQVEEEQQNKQFIEENKEVENDQKEIITLEDEQEDKFKEVEKLINEPIRIESIIAKIEKRKLVYVAQIDNGDTLTFYPDKEESFINDNREKAKKMLIDYAVEQYEDFDKKVVNKLDPNICGVLQKFADKYNNDAGKLMYDYAISFSHEGDVNSVNVPDITYNVAEIKKAGLKGKQKKLINKICKNASKNDNITIIDKLKGISRLKYAIKKLFGINNVQLLPEGKH